MYFWWKFASALRLTKRSSRNQASSLVAARIFTGGAAGLLAGLFGVGGGVIMVPLQIVLLGETIKGAIQTSLGVIVITAISACLGHAVHGNLWLTSDSLFEQKIVIGGIIMGMGGLLGAQLSTRLLPKLPDEIITIAFRTLLAILAVYIFWQAWRLSEVSFLLSSQQIFESFNQFCWLKGFDNVSVGALLHPPITVNFCIF